MLRRRKMDKRTGRVHPISVTPLYSAASEVLVTIFTYTSLEGNDSRDYISLQKKLENKLFIPESNITGKKWVSVTKERKNG